MNNDELAGEAGRPDDANQAHDAAAQADGAEQAEEGSQLLEDSVAKPRGEVLLDAILAAFPPEAAEGNEDEALVFVTERILVAPVADGDTSEPADANEDADGPEDADLGLGADANEDEDVVDVIDDLDDMVEMTEIDVITLRNPSAAAPAPQGIPYFSATPSATEDGDNTGTLIQLKHAPGYGLPTATGAAIRLIGRGIFSKLPCFKAFSDKMREAGVDGLGEIWFAECSSKNADTGASGAGADCDCNCEGDCEGDCWLAPPDVGAKNRAAMVSLVRHYAASPHFYRHRQPASLTAGPIAEDCSIPTVPRACAAEVSFQVLEGYLPKICLIVDKDISMLVVHENEEMGCPSNHTYLYAWPGGEAFYPNGATLDGMAQPGGVISLARSIRARDFFNEVVADTIPEEANNS